MPDGWPLRAAPITPAVRDAFEALEDALGIRVRVLNVDSEWTACRVGQTVWITRAVPSAPELHEAVEWVRSIVSPPAVVA